MCSIHLIHSFLDSVAQIDFAFINHSKLRIRKNFFAEIVIYIKNLNLNHVLIIS